MRIYIDNEFKCHTSNPHNLYRSIETDFFDGKCSDYIEGYRYVPAGETWTREDGVDFSGLMITPFVNYSTLIQAQLNYVETTRLEDQQAIESAYINGVNSI